MTLTQFDPPGFLTDISGADLQLWSNWVSQQLDDARNNNGSSVGLLNDGPRLQFFNTLKNPQAADAIEKDITWTAFPRVVQVSSVSNQQRWQRADASRDVQDEYCEWCVERDPNSGKVVRVTFTSEGPEYWAFLAQQSPDTVLALYQQHISTQVKKSDLYDSHGDYIKRNRWNNSTQTGAMHLIQQANTLGAEIELAAAATIVRVQNGQPLTSEQDLIACSRYGEPKRNSDPHIGAQVNALARAKDDVTLANPVGLCIDGLSVAGWQTPDGSPASDYWKITRGTPAKALRAVYEVPAGKSFVVGDIQINGKLIEFGAQIADFISIKLTGLATRLGQSQVQPFAACASIAATASGASLTRFTQGAARPHR